MSGWDDSVRWVDRIAALSERLVAEEVRFAIDSAWPEDTAWSRANNRVREGQSSDFPLEPPTRPNETGALSVFANANVERDIRALQQHKTPGLVAIGNAVPYARDVGNNPQAGYLIYIEAGKEGGPRGAARVNLQWQRDVGKP